jgi:predicted transposase/invertase (TIGR01784 family)
MVTDPLFYRLFATSPETLFLLLGMSTDEARAMAARYQYEALEFKETAHRLDGVFQPKEAGLPLYFVEVQFYYLPSVYADLLVKAFTYLKRHDPGQEFRGVVLFADRSLEPQELTPYRALLDAGVIKPYYLNETPELAIVPLSLSILFLIRQPEDQAPETARELVARTKQEIADAALRADLLELIETVMIYKLRSLSREEIQAMLKVHDIRETRVYQEALVEGETKGVEKERARLISELAAENMSPSKIANILKLDIELVRKELAKKQP